MSSRRVGSFSEPLQKGDEVALLLLGQEFSRALRVVRVVLRRPLAVIDLKGREFGEQVVTVQADNLFQRRRDVVVPVGSRLSDSTQCRDVERLEVVGVAGNRGAAGSAVYNCGPKFGP